MKKVLFAVVLFCCGAVLEAQALDGIRVVCPTAPVRVYVDGTEVSLPTNSCFVANLSRGSYRIEAYIPSNVEGQRGKRIFSQEVVYPGRGVTDVVVELHAAGNDYPSFQRPGMSQVQFDRFLTAMKAESFDKDKTKLMDMFALDRGISTAQIAQIVQLYSFDHGKLEILKKLYPYTVDRENYFTLLEQLDFSATKNELKDFVSKWREQN